METFKAVTARYKAPELISKRSEVSGAVRDLLSEKVKPYGADIINIDVRDFSFSPEYAKAINEKVTQDQAAQAAEAKLRTVAAEQQQVGFPKALEKADK